jgi:hypothetical protein
VVVVRERPHRPGRCGQRLLCQLDHAAQGAGGERRVEEREVEGEVELVVVRSVEGGHLVHVQHVRLSDEQAPRLVPVGERTPAPDHLVGSVDVRRREQRHATSGGCVPEAEVLDRPVDDVDAEARDPAVEPEAQDAVELVAHGGDLPVQVRHLGQEAVQVVALPALVELPGGAAEDRAPVRRTVGPDVPVAVLAEEPGMPVARVVRDQVEQDADPAPPGLGDEEVDVVQRAEVRMDARVIRDVVAPVLVRRREGRVEPDPVDAEPLEIVELVDQPEKVAVAVPVRVGEAAWIDLVEDAVLPPRGPREVR